MIAFSLWLALASLAWLPMAWAQGPRRVVVVTPDNAWSQFEERVSEELAASGFQVERVSSQTNAALDEQLKTIVARRGAYAGVLAQRNNSTAAVTVWMPESQQLQRAEARQADAPFTAGTMALRVAELLSFGELDLHFVRQPQAKRERPEPPATEPTDRVPEPETPDTDARLGLRVWTSVGAGFSSGVTAPSLPVSLDTEQPFTQHVSLQLGVTAEPVGLRTDTSLGEVTTHTTGFSAAVFLTLVSRSQLSFDIGAAGAAVLVSSEAAARGNSALASRDSVWVFAPSIPFRLRGPLVGGLRWHLTGKVGTFFPEVKLRGGDDVLASLGRPSSSLAGGVGWQF